jgi:hypothetical protein
MAKGTRKSAKKATKKPSKKAASKTGKKAVKKAAAKSPKKAANKAPKKAKLPPGTWQVVCNVHGPVGTYPSQAAANLAYARHTEGFPDDEVKIVASR